MQPSHLEFDWQSGSNSSRHRSSSSRLERFVDDIATCDPEWCFFESVMIKDKLLGVDSEGMQDGGM